MIPDELQGFFGKLQDESAKCKKDGYLLEKQAAYWGKWQSATVMAVSITYCVTCLILATELDNGWFAIASAYSLYLACDGIQGLFGALAKREALKHSTTKLEVEGL